MKDFALSESTTSGKLYVRYTFSTSSLAAGLEIGPPWPMGNVDSPTPKKLKLKNGVVTYL